jgi:pimeloyl-ACP methyl ester carboxylesterase
MKNLYKSVHAKARIMELYEQKLDSLYIPYSEQDIATSFGRTRVIVTGKENGQPIVLFHGIHAGSPLTLEAVKPLHDSYRLYAIDTIGQATKSEETQINIHDESYAVWAAEVMDGLGLSQAVGIGVSYGAFILQKLITHFPKKVTKCIFVVPGRLVNGHVGASLVKLTFPLLRYLITRKDAHLQSFIKAFVPNNDTFQFQLQKALLSGVYMDYRRPVLLKKEDVAHYEGPVYCVVADHDVFFPGEAALRRAREVFRNFSGYCVLQQCKHMPDSAWFPEINQQIGEWMEG